MWESIKNFFSGNVWLGFSKDEAVGTGTYRFTFGSGSIVAAAIKLLQVGKQYSTSGYTFTIKNVETMADGRTLVTADTTSAPQPNQAGALGWGVLLGGVGAALLFQSIEKIEKLVDTTTTRTIQLAVVVLLIVVAWKYAKR
jgi:choline-glycine betaine transporter